MLKTLINSACSKHTRVMEIFHVCALFAKWTAARTTCLMIWRRPSGGLGSKEKLTWPSLPGNSVNAFWDCCSQRWTGLKIRGGMEMRRTFLHRKHTILFCFLVVFLRPMSATLCPFFFTDPRCKLLSPWRQIRNRKLCQVRARKLRSPWEILSSRNKTWTLPSSLERFLRSAAPRLLRLPQSTKFLWTVVEKYISK